MLKCLKKGTKMEIKKALPSIMAGVFVAALTSVGTTTLTASENNVRISIIEHDMKKVEPLLPKVAAIESKQEAQEKSIDEIKSDIKAMRNEMHRGFADIMKEIKELNKGNDSD